MEFFDRISRVPRAYKPEIGTEVAESFPDFPNTGRELVAGIAGSSPYLAGLLGKEASWLSRLLDHSPDELCAEVFAGLDAPDLATQFRQAKRRIAVLTAMADLAGVWSLDQVTGALTGLADRCVDIGARRLIAEEIARGKLPGLCAHDGEQAGGYAVLAMGKMGAAELNYSSDIDLICLFDETRFDPDDYYEARKSFIRVTRKLTGLLADVTAEGYVFRTDLRLRPDASVTPVCIAMETAERYYESLGRTWERAAFIKARCCGGDIAAGEAFLQRLTPFIWRRHLDFAAIQDAHDMRLRIRDHKGLGGTLTLNGHDLKLGQGGIREIEFFTQTRQIIAGGRDPSLRVRGTLEGLDRLSAAGWVEEPVRDTLSTNYIAYRELEHRLQMIGDAQTHALPTDEDGFHRLACLMARNPSDLRAEIETRLRDTSALTEAFFTPSDQSAVDDAADIYLERWRSLPALRSPRAVEIFARVFPGLLKGLQETNRPREAMQAFETFLQGLPAGVQLFSLFEANPQLTGMIVDICTASPALAAYLARNASVFDAVLGGAFFSPWPGSSGLTAQLSDSLAKLTDYETQLDAARRWQKEWHFRIGVHQLRGLIAPEEAGTQYADLAEACVGALFPVVCTEFARKYGPAPGRGAALLAMGSLGAGRLTAGSDLDLIVIYDAAGEDASVGPRPLASRIYFARLTQALVTALSAPTAEGKLYEVDMRLRPSGQSGPVAISLEAFDSYQRNDAWLWEHMALTRARVIAGEAGLQASVAALRKEVLQQSRAAAAAATEAQEMRQRLVDAGRLGSHWAVKDGPGGVQDIELFSQLLALLAGSTARRSADQLEAAEEVGLIQVQTRRELTDALSRFGRVTHALRLLADVDSAPDSLGAGGQNMVLRDLDAPDLATADADLAECRKRAKTLIDQTITRLMSDDSGVSALTKE